MSDSELVLAGAIVFLSVALMILSVKVYRYERHFTSIQKLFFILGTKIHSLEHAVGIEHEHNEEKKNVHI